MSFACCSRAQMMSERDRPTLASIAMFKRTNVGDDCSLFRVVNMGSPSVT